MLLRVASRRAVAARALNRRHLTVAATGASGMIGTARRAVAAASRRHLTVAVTGASGYVGSYVTEELLKRGHDVRALVRGCDSNKEKAAHLRALPGADQLTLVDGGDLGVKGSFKNGLAGADAVVHAAATVVIGRDPSIASAAVDGVENVLSSSATVVGGRHGLWPPRDVCSFLCAQCMGVTGSSFTMRTCCLMWR